MGHSEKNAGPAWGSSRVEITGTLARQPEMVFLPPEGRRFCEVLVHCAGDTHRVVAYDDLAERVRDVPAETRLKVEGKLVRQDWKTGEGKLREQLIIQAHTIVKYDG